MSKKQIKLVSIVIPCWNEEANIKRYPDELLPELEKLKYDYELICVDDGSSDNTWEELQKLAEKYPTVKALRHARNYGMGAGYQTAFDAAKGDYIVTFSGEIEIPAARIKEVIDKLDEGFDVVNTNRTGRWQETGSSSMLRRTPSNLANKMIANISGIDIKDTGSGLKGFRKFVIDNLRIYGDMHRFLLAYSTLFTKRITEFDVEYAERTNRPPAYGSLKRTFAVFLDLFALKFMLSFATRPFTMMPGRIFGSAGIVSFGIGSLITFYLLLVKLGGQSIGDRPLFIGGLILIIFGVQLIMTGLLGELMMRTYFESSGRKVYIVSEKTDE